MNSKLNLGCVKDIKNLLKRMGIIKCNHKYLPIYYGFLQRAVNEKGEIITNPEIKGYFEGGCCYSENYPNYKCVICGKYNKNERKN